MTDGQTDRQTDRRTDRIPIARPRLHSMQRGKNHILNIRDANMFHNRVINFWNKLPDSVVLAASISSFKRLLLSFVVNVGFEHFSVN